MNKIEFKKEVSLLVGCTPNMIHVKRKRKYGDYGKHIVEVSAIDEDLIKYEVENYTATASECFEETLLALQDIEDELPKNMTYTRWKQAKEIDGKLRRKND